MRMINALNVNFAEMQFLVFVDCNWSETRENYSPDMIKYSFKSLKFSEKYYETKNACFSLEFVS